MAIKVSGTTVIDDSRNVLNVGTLDVSSTITSSGSIISSAGFFVDNTDDGDQVLLGVLDSSLTNCGQLTAFNFNGAGGPSDWSFQNTIKDIWFTNVGNTSFNTTTPLEKFQVNSTGILVTPDVTYASDQEATYLTVGVTNGSSTYQSGGSDTTNWGTFGFQHRLKSNPSGSPRITVDTAQGEVFSLDNNGNMIVAGSLTSESIQASGNVVGDRIVSNQFYGDGLNNGVLIDDVTDRVSFVSDAATRFFVEPDYVHNATGNMTMPPTSDRTKYNVWTSTTAYGIGMQDNFTFGGLNDDFAMTFEMNSSDNRGFWWGDNAHANNQGAMALTTAGELTVANSLRIGYGESDTTDPGATFRTIDVNGTILVQGANSTSSIELRRTSVDSYSGITWTDGGIDRWLMYSSNSIDAQFVVQARNSSGAVVGSALTIENDTRVVGCPSGVNVTNGSSTFNRTNAVPMIVNRNGSDGLLVLLEHDGTIEGNISVSGTTVSYNGAHLTRWSQLIESGRPTILRGTVLSNLDEMCEWDGEENEQLNKMKVSDVPGDRNVAGVFQSWDTDDQDNDDFYCAQTGDFIIRIGPDTVVQRGDLLESAGDGTARPQDNDTVLSKTIAKVTSTHRSHVYEDGSYLVPCVLMVS